MVGMPTGLLFTPHAARHWSRTEAKDGDNVVTGSSITVGGVIQCHLLRNLTSTVLDEQGLSSTTGGKVLMDIQYHDQVKVGDELQIDADRWQVVTPPQRATGIGAFEHCWVYVKKAEID